MDIPDDKSWFAKYRWLLLLLLLALLISVALVVASGAFKNSSTSTDELIFAQVEQGHFAKRVSAYGTLKPQQQRTLISRSAGTLVEIRKRPGEQVTADSVVLVLSNPDVVSAVRKAKLELQKAKADFAALEAELLDQQMTMANERRMLQAEISTKRAELEAQEILAKESIISKLDLRKARMQLHQLELQLELAQEKEQSAAASIEAKRSSGRLAVEQAEYVLEVEQEKYQALQVTAGIDGVLQSQDSDLALGQWLRPGESLGIVSGTKNLFAELNVNATEASSVQLGMPVQLSIRGRQVSGEVVRVAPNAKQNQVQVDVTISEQLPDIARANLDIRGDITIVQQADAYLLPRPQSYQAGQPLELYVQQADENYQLQTIDVLEASSDHLLINKKVGLGRQVLLNNVSQWQRRRTITIQN